MPAKLSTHVLDIAHGCPAAGMKIELWSLDGEDRELISTAKTNPDGRTDAPLLSADEMKTGQYEIIFFAGDYFAAKSPTLPRIRFLDKIPVRFGIADAEPVIMCRCFARRGVIPLIAAVEMNAAQKIMQRIEALAKISETPENLTRTFATPAMRRANSLVAKWMREAGMKTRVDAIENLIGHYAGEKSGAKILLLGSHLDTVRNAGKFDGPLGVILAIACVEELRRKKIKLPFAVEVVGFADEEGVRFQSAYLGSKVLAGDFDEKDLARKDAGGISMRDAIKSFGGDPAKLKSTRLNPKNLLGYLEAHIEQGPVLENKNLAVGIVSAIAGQTRAKIIFTGHAGHAGTTPMSLRKDALCAAAEFILAAENLARKTRGLVATVGEISAKPGAGNVIPGEAQLSLDLRHAKDSVRKSALKKIKRIALEIASRRKMKLDFENVHESPAVACSETFSKLLGKFILRRQKKMIQLPSGAGHDAAVMAKICPAAMLFIRCKNGISHHPDESAKVQDVQIALDVMTDFLKSLAEKYRQATGKSGKTFL